MLEEIKIAFLLFIFVIINLAIVILFDRLFIMFTLF